MKKLPSLLLIFTLFLSSCDDSDDENVKESSSKVSQEVIDSTKEAFKKEVQIRAVVYEEGTAVEWKLVVDGREFLNSDGTIARRNNVANDLKTKAWNDYASAMCNILYQTQYASKEDGKNHIIRIIDGITLENTNFNWRKSSLGSCNCKTWEPFDK